MRRKLSFLIFLLCLGSKLAFSSVGDTIKIKTFTYDIPRPSGNGPRIGTFVLPDSLNGKTFSKILMRYSLKCDPTQSPKCGEWDYLTYSILKEKTGRMDSTLMTQPSFKVDYLVKDSLSYINNPSYKYSPRLFKNASFQNINSKDSIIVGNGNLLINNIFSSSTNDGRSLFILRANDLIANGFSSGTINSLRFYTQGINSSIGLKGMKVDLKLTSDTIVNHYSALNGLTRVFSNDYSLVNNANDVIFDNAFNWDGVSNIIVSLSYESKDNGEINILGQNRYSGALSSSIDKAHYLRMGTISQIPVDGTILDSVNNEVTIMFWSYGDEEVQPKPGSAFEGISSNNKRVLNSHLPWSAGNIYWDAGSNGSSYDRISKTANANEYMGKWNHYTFTKNASTGVMNIYLNGDLWLTGSGKTLSLTDLKRFIIGTCPTCTEPNKPYQGSLDNFNMFYKVLSQSEIKAYMNSKVNSSLAKFDKLVFAFDMNEGNGNIINSSANNSYTNSVLEGFEDWREYRGERVNDFTASSMTPNITLFRINGNLVVDSVYKTDSITRKPMSIVRYDNVNSPTIASDTIYKWSPYYRYSYNTNGSILDSVYLDKDTTIYKTIINYYSTPFEVVNKWELGRFITPYGIGLDLGSGWTWTYDVSDFVQKLKDTISLEAGNFQELLDLQFWFIEGTPSRDVKSIENVWQGNINLTAFDTKVLEKKYKFNQDEKMVKLRTCLTGHGMEATNSAWAEFSPNIHSIMVNGQTKWSWQIIQECADNPLYPQGGTWIFDRAAWCPGMPGKQEEFELTPYIIGDSIAIRYTIAEKEGGNYVTESQLVRYSDPNFLLDASVETIVVPSDDKLYSRENPSVGNPKIIIKNNGSTTLTSAKITYYIQGGTINTYNWTGSLDFLKSEIVSLPIPDWSELIGDNGYFVVEISEPNSSVDEYPYNNKNISHFKLPVAQTTNKVRLTYRTNHAPNETKWKLSKANGDIVYQSPNSLNANTSYSEIIPLSNGGYKLFVSDANDDGLEFWYNMNNGGTAGSTRLTFYDTVNSYWGNDIILEPDFGKSIEYDFVVNGFVGLSDINASFRGVLLYPNPTSNTATLIVDGVDGRADISVRDYLGRIIDTYSENSSNNRIQKQIDISSYPIGIYIIQIRNNDKISTQKLIKK